MIVVDACVLADMFVNGGELHQRATKLSTVDPEWISSALWRYELGNVVRTSVRCGELKEEEVLGVWPRAEQVVIETVGAVDFVGIYAVAEKHGLSFYDASYVYLARLRTLKLHTRDKQVLRECPDVARPMPEL